jgi:hypothetical protein
MLKTYDMSVFVLVLITNQYMTLQIIVKKNVLTLRVKYSILIDIAKVIKILQV